MNYISELQEAVDTISPKQLSHVVKKNIPLFEFVQQQVGESISEKIYNALHPGENTCARGNAKKFHSMAQGYNFCSAHCPCAKAVVSRKVSATKRAMSENDIQASNAKRVSTNLEKYGVTNVGQTKKALTAHAAVYANRK